ncbi:ribosomal protein S19 [Drechmeria coniospora]|uniref:Ribosomal protein S19 n=1 Tax=Drechmeria coniospora TaxID=98403 RepID=A0A151GGU6_DRECN|nr:ribosomal protein S19 [Drechmeria coniospora]KYK56251.1 ribosomal protein S19 [Drechmeria coniospora]
MGSANADSPGPHLVPLPIVFPKKQGDVPPAVRTQARSATILPSFVGLKFEIHNGKDYHQVLITEDMVGHKLGEFSPCAPLFVASRRSRIADVAQDAQAQHLG